MTIIYNICIIYKMPNYKRSKSQKKNGGAAASEGADLPREEAGVQPSLVGAVRERRSVEQEE
jgi:hypothetical protein